MSNISKEIISEVSGLETGNFLALETGIGGGSLALFSRNEQIGCWVGEREVSRSEDILLEIDNLLETNKLTKDSIKLICFSNGPGSFTGLRIGASIARGLARSLGCRILTVPILPALARRMHDENVVAAVLLGAQVCWQCFNENEFVETLSGKICGKTFITELKDFPRQLNELRIENLIIQKTLYGKLFTDSSVNSVIGTGFVLNKNLFCVDRNLASIIGVASLATPIRDRACDDDLIYPIQYSPG